MTKPESRGPELEIHSPGIHGNGNLSGIYYKVEYRTSYPEPKLIPTDDPHIPLIIDHYWRTLHIRHGTQQWGVNIPIKSWDTDACKHGLLSYVAAEAHRWAFIAALEGGAGGPGGSLCVETRLVAVKFSIEYKTEELGVYPPSWAHQYEPSEGKTPRAPKLPTQEKKS